MFSIQIFFILISQLFPDALGHGCLTNQFRCLTGGECLKGEEVCDNWPDCVDSSDEFKTQCNILSGGLFLCKGGGTTKFWQVCDGVQHCSDASDETEELCQESFCHLNQFKCKYGACLHSGGPCDGVEDCLDGSDEDKDLCKGKQCNTDQFRCSDGKCIGMKEVCDAVEDCFDGADEEQGHCRNITDGLFTCGNTTREYWRVCDGIADCPLHLDENIDLCDSDTCHDNQFQCEYGACLYHGEICDTVMNCADESDESDALCASHKCYYTDFRCDYGACLSRTSVCDGKQDCKDQSDELQPYCQNITSGKYTCWNGKTINAWEICDGKIHCSDAGDESVELCSTFTCHANQFKCDYGACTGVNPCDGNPDCVDGSDETENLCSTNKCSDEFFRCDYGACIDKILVCNGKKNCMDASDEGVLLCQNNTCFDHQFHCASGGCVRIWPCVEEKNCTEPNLRPSHLNTATFRCSDGSTIPAKKVCDLENDCPDKSDEDYILCNNLRVDCVGEMCDYQFPSTACDGEKNCLDWSDESYQMCNSLRCMLPHYPEHGTYNCSNAKGKPGDVFKSISLTIFCDEGYDVKGNAEVFCNNGTWSAYPLPPCIRYCTIEEDPSISYRCLVDPETGETRPCHHRELSGTVALPSCNGPNYYSLQDLPHLTCFEGFWDDVANCSTECGKVTPVGVALIANGTTAQHGEIPWYAGIYEKKKKIHQQICGGTIVNRNVVISAAHCFWGLDLAERKEKILPAKNYAVAVGKLYRTWNNRNDVDTQRADVSSILVPQDYEGGLKSHQADIAVLILSKSFDYKPFIRPICLSFDPEFDENQLQPGSMGKIAGWGLTGPNSGKAKTLQVVELPFVDTEQCSNSVPADFKEFITLDKFCAGYLNQGTAVCLGDSGSGIAFPETFDGVQRFFLRGIASVSPRRNSNINDCNVEAYTTMTSIFKHRHFIKQHF